MSAVILIRREGVDCKVDLGRVDNKALRLLVGELAAGLTAIDVRLAQGGSLAWEERARAARVIVAKNLDLVQAELERRARRKAEADQAEAERQSKAERIAAMQAMQEASRKARLERIQASNDFERKMFAAFKQIVRQHVPGERVTTWLIEAETRAKAEQQHQGRNRG